MKMEESTKRRKYNTSPIPIKVEVKEENVLGNDYLMAKGRLQGVLKQLTEQSESESEDSEEETKNYRSKKTQDSPRKKADAIAVRSTYLMKLYDRSVDLARFEEDTPLYPICRAWMANNNKKPQTIIKRRLSSPEPDPNWSMDIISDTYRMPPPNGPFISRVPSPIPEQMEIDQNFEKLLNSDDKTMKSKHQLMKEHSERWSNIKRKWIETAMKNEDRYTMSKHVLQSIYNRAQESMSE